MAKKREVKPKGKTKEALKPRLEKKPTLIACLLIMVVGALVYFNVLDNALVWDDEAQVVENTAIQNVHSISDFAHLFQGSTFSSNGAGKLAGQYYKPMMSVFFAVAWAVGGGSPVAFHLIQVLFFIANAVLFFFFLRKFYPHGASLLVALLFLVCPIGSEVARYVADYQDTLYFFWGLLALVIYMYLEESMAKVKLHLLVGTCLLFSLLSKETGALFLGTIVFYRALTSKEGVRGAATIFGTTVVVFAIYLYMRIGVAGMTVKHEDFLAPIGRTTLDERLMTIPKIWMCYIVNFFFPYDLGVSKHWVVREATTENFWIPLAVMLSFLGAIALTVWKLRSRTAVFFVLWFLMGMALHSQFFPLDTTAADRWFYFPMAALFALMTEAALRWRPGLANSKVAVGILSVLILAFGVRTAWRNDDWQTGLSLFTRDLPFSPDSFELQNNVGTEQFRTGQIKEACEHFRISTELAPHWWTSFNNLGVCFQREGNYQKALEHFQTAITNGNYYLAYVNYAQLLAGTGKKDEARKFLAEKALVMYPQSPDLLRLAQQLGK